MKQLSNAERLKQRISEKGYTMKDIAGALNISESTCRHKCNDLGAFFASEVQALKDLLELSCDEAFKIFFSDLYST